MGVPKHERRVGKLLFIEAVRDLRVSTLEHLYRERVVPSRVRHHFADQIMKLVDDIDLKVHQANNIRPEMADGKTDYHLLKERQDLQREAIELLDLVARNVQTLVWCKYTKKNSITLWSKSITHCRTMLTSWTKADTERYGLVRVDSKGTYYLERKKRNKNDLVIRRKSI